MPTIHLKRRLIKEKIIEYKCRDCNNDGIWNNKKISLHLEHINGVPTDNRLLNLCFLCPNCHSQTETYAGKNNKYYHDTRNCTICNTPIGNGGRTGLCFSCVADQKNKLRLSKTELELLLKQCPVSQIAKKYQVSENCIRKKAKKMNLKYLIKERGYWSKKR